MAWTESISPTNNELIIPAANVRDFERRGIKVFDPFAES
jgi:hypothetical protein